MACDCRKDKQNIQLHEVVELARRYAKKKGQYVYITRCRNGNYDFTERRPDGGYIAIVVG